MPPDHLSEFSDDRTAFSILSVVEKYRRSEHSGPHFNILLIHDPTQRPTIPSLIEKSALPSLLFWLSLYGCQDKNICDTSFFALKKNPLFMEHLSTGLESVHHLFHYHCIFALYGQTFFFLNKLGRQFKHSSLRNSPVHSTNRTVFIHQVN